MRYNVLNCKGGQGKTGLHIIKAYNQICIRVYNKA